MKKLVLLILMPCIVLLIISWDKPVHQSIGAIADRNLSPQAKQAVKEILDGKTLADISEDADETPSDPEYKFHLAWHDIKVPAGLNHDQFISYVKNLKDPNLYQVYTQFVGSVSNPFESEGNPKKHNALVYNLKWLVSNVEDMHDPVHVGPMAKGENAPGVKINGRKTNLYTLWDNELFKDDALKSAAIANISIKKWQADPVLQWLWESYQSSCDLYRIGLTHPDLTKIQMDEFKISAALKIERAGVRLAGLLNRIFESYEYRTATGKTPCASGRAMPVLIKNCNNHIGDSVIVYGRLFLVSDPSSMEAVWAVKSPFANTPIKVAIPNDISNNCLALNGHQITARGVLSKQNNDLMLEVNDPSGISVTGDVFNEFR